MYGGSHGVGAGTCKNLTVQNCEFGWIGGALQHYKDGVPTRFGNAVEIYGGCEGYYVRDNYVYQCYDAGITQQIRVSEDASIPTTKVYAQKDVQYTGNVVEYSNYSIEYFLSRIPEGNPSYIKGFLIEDNLMWYSGQGFCEQRPDRTYNSSSHIKGWLGASRNRASDYVTKNNLMVYSANTLVEAVSDLYNEDGSPSAPSTSGNNYVQYIGSKFGAIAQDNAAVQKYNLGVIDYIGGLSDGTDTYWFAEAPDEEAEK